MSRRTLRAWASVIVTVLSLSLICHAQDPARTKWKWWDKDGLLKSRKDLDSILSEHKLWVDSNTLEGKRADLRGAHLAGVDLPSAELTGALLNDARMICVGSKCADLERANLRFAEMQGAGLYGADLSRAIFEPTSIPEIRGMASALHLEDLTYKDNPDALVQLRRQFQDEGFYEQERKITYALKRREAERSWEACKSKRFSDNKARAILWSSDSNLANCGSLVLNRVFFDWTCQYGMSPGRPLLLGLVLWFLCSLLYAVFIHVPGRAGLYRVYSESLEPAPTDHRVVKRIELEFIATHGWWGTLQYLRRELYAFRTAMLFSLMSAFNIGFRDINFGRWLRLLTRQEFEIKPVGWTRVIAGWQSLVSVYLIALWVLTFFGRPFE
jgi:uncharacterized protein YjbI with pentapeptide repeats